MLTPNSALGKALVTLVLHVWAAASPGLEKSGHAPEVASALAFAVYEDRDNPPIFTSHAEDLAVLAYWAFRESSLDPGAVGDGGKSCGVLQLACAGARGRTIAEQASAWLYLVRLGKRKCLEEPRGHAPAPATSYAWGACHARDSLTGRDVADLARDREARARQLLVVALARGGGSS